MHFFLTQICVHCKRGGANMGCWKEIGENTKLFCDRSYHVDCGLQRGATFTVSADSYTLSKCWVHSEKADR